MAHEAEPLELATTEELVKELERRFSGGVLVLGSRETPGDPESERFEMFRRANLTMAFGLMDRGRIMLVAHDESVGEVGPEDGP